MLHGNHWNHADNNSIKLYIAIHSLISSTDISLSAADHADISLRASFIYRTDNFKFSTFY